MRRGELTHKPPLPSSSLFHDDDLSREENYRLAIMISEALMVGAGILFALVIGLFCFGWWSLVS